MGIELIPAMGISSSGLQAERTRLEVAAHNLANARSTQDHDGGIYRRRQVVFAAVLDDRLGDRGHGLGGVRVSGIVHDPTPPLEQYLPEHPHADANGIVRVPNISPVIEMMDMMTASRAYEANLSVLKSSREMANNTINLLRGQ